ncbi:MAG: hypothetical protein AVDCRST_MAG73-4075, partial [uncultured Thermomicrobiales bacterium]
WPPSSPMPVPFAPRISRRDWSGSAGRREPCEGCGARSWRWIFGPTA